MERLPSKEQHTRLECSSSPEAEAVERRHTTPHTTASLAVAAAVAKQSQTIPNQ